MTHSPAPIRRLDTNQPHRLRGLEEAQPIWAGPALPSNPSRLMSLMRRLIQRFTGKRA